MNFFTKAVFNIQKFIIIKKYNFLIQNEVRGILSAWLSFELLWQKGHGSQSISQTIFMEWYEKNYERPKSLPSQDTLRSTLRYWLYKEISKSWASKQL